MKNKVMYGILVVTLLGIPTYLLGVCMYAISQLDMYLEWQLALTVPPAILWFLTIQYLITDEE